MPLTTRAVSPVDLSQNRLNASVQRDELQYVANGTLANLIRQMSSLNCHAEQLFTEVHREMLKIDHKSNNLFVRVERLTQKVLQSDFSKIEPASLEENHLRKAFKSTNIVDQHSLDRQTLPNTLQELYQKCDAPPDLDQLNPYRDDPKSALTYYTDPSYFFDLWKEEMLKDVGRAGRSTRSPGAGGVNTSKSPSRGRRRQRAPNSNYSQQQHLNPIHHTNVLLGHYGSVGGTYNAAQVANGRYGASQAIGSNQNNAQQLHFPAEYQAPQHALMQSSDGKIQPPPGMSLHAAEAKHSSLQQQYVYSQQQIAYQQHDRPLNAVVPQQNTNQQFLMTDSNDGNVEKNFREMSLNPNVGNGSTAPAAVAANFVGFLEDDEDDELPPPPPILSARTMMSATNTVITSSSPSTSGGLSDMQFSYKGADGSGNFTQNQPFSDAMQFVPSGGNASATQERDNPSLLKPQGLAPPPAPPPPPPPPPASQFNVTRNLAAGGGGSFAAKISDSKIGDAGKQGGMGSKDTEQSGAKNEHADNEGGGSQISSLLMEIQSGIKLKKVQRQEELAEVRAAHASNDVAAILKRRMEHIMGNDESSDSNDADSNSDWDD